MFCAHCTILQPMCTFRGGHRRHHREHRSFRPKIALPWSVKFLKDNTIEKFSGDRQKVHRRQGYRGSHCARKTSSDKVAFILLHKELDPISWIWLASLCVLNHPMAISIHLFQPDPNSRMADSCLAKGFHTLHPK